MQLMKEELFFMVPVILVCVGFSEAGILYQLNDKDGLQQPELFQQSALGVGDIFENKTCQGLDDCSHVNNSVCLENLCACPEDKPVFVNVTGDIAEGVCLEETNHTRGNCSYSQQCSYGHSVCSDGVCGCEASFNDDGNGGCVKNKKSAAIPIAVGSVIGVACVGTLLAYWWMSRSQKQHT